MARQACVAGSEEGKEEEGEGKRGREKQCYEHPLSTGLEEPPKHKEKSNGATKSVYQGVKPV